MNKLILLLLIFSVLAFAGGEDGTGEPTTSNADETVYNLVCTPMTGQNEYKNCVVVELETED